MLNKLAKIKRSVTISESLEVLIDLTETPFFWCEIIPPKTFKSNTEVNPRNSPAHVVRYGVTSFSPLKEITPGTTLEIDSIEYEVISGPRDVRWGPTTYQKELECIPTSDLYPYKCALVDKGGVAGTQDIPIALWNEAEDTQSHGQYVSMTGYLGLEEHPLDSSNVEIVIGTQRYNISRAAVDYVARVFNVTLRRSGRG